VIDIGTSHRMARRACGKSHHSLRVQGQGAGRAM
jgi:hypothetical protein